MRPTSVGPSSLASNNITISISISNRLLPHRATAALHSSDPTLLIPRPEMEAQFCLGPSPSPAFQPSLPRTPRPEHLPAGSDRVNPPQG
ncbi:hypothetical protein B0T16DRAFT_399055 [Cercophora newfieldiana]|uniref:Uncharacterized protein n=1 Tax=Cercophora newfieldiana TaxID=92897 RepID=A0AA39YPH0_9PEZI|nr:hypothetical protein B0T16DRAFT_399055 [Cercophora newfieldiana]